MILIRLELIKGNINGAYTALASDDENEDAADKFATAMHNLCCLVDLMYYVAHNECEPGNEQKALRDLGVHFEDADEVLEKTGKSYAVQLQEASEPVAEALTVAEENRTRH